MVEPLTQRYKPSGIEKIIKHTHYKKIQGSIKKYLKIRKMVKITKAGRIAWSKEDQDSLLIFYKENSQPSLSERAKLAAQLDVPVKKVTNWFNFQKRKFRNKLKVPTFLKKKKPKSSKSKIKIEGVEESHIQETKVESQGVPEASPKPKVIKLRKYSLEKPVAKREVFRIIQPKTQRHRGVLPKKKFKSNTDVHFLDCRSPTNELLSEAQLHDAVDRFVNADFSETDEDFNEDPTLLDQMDLTDRSLDVTFFDAGKLDNAFIQAEQSVDFGNIETLISNAPPNITPPSNTDIHQFLTDFNNDLKKCADLKEEIEMEEILDLHVGMIADIDDEDEDDLNAFQPIDDTIENFQHQTVTLAYL